MQQDAWYALLSALGTLLAGADLPLDGTRLEASLIEDGLAIRVDGHLRLTPLGLKVLWDLRRSLLRAEIQHRFADGASVA